MYGFLWKHSDWINTAWYYRWCTIVHYCIVSHVSLLGGSSCGGRRFIIIFGSILISGSVNNLSYITSPAGSDFIFHRIRESAEYTTVLTRISVQCITWVKPKWISILHVNLTSILALQLCCFFSSQIQASIKLICMQKFLKRLENFICYSLINSFTQLFIFSDTLVLYRVHLCSLEL